MCDEIYFHDSDIILKLNDMICHRETTLRMNLSPR